ncbi:MAG: rRNA maturation RNase YbeY [Bdellovibrionales bacterium]
MPLTIDIAATAAWEKALPKLPALTKRVLSATLPKKFAKVKTEVSVVFTTDTKIQKLNREWRSKDKPTNVLSFPLSPPVHFGDIVLAFQTIRREAANENKTLEQHVAHLLVHGMLHLLGYDHEKDADALIMMRKEKAILKTLGYENPYRAYDH